MLSCDEKVMKILNILIIESEMKVTYFMWLLKYFVSLVYIISKLTEILLKGSKTLTHTSILSIYEHNMRLFWMIFVSSVVINHKNLLWYYDRFLKFMQYFVTYENNISRSAIYCGYVIKQWNSSSISSDWQFLNVIFLSFMFLSLPFSIDKSCALTLNRVKLFLILISLFPITFK